MDLLIFSLTLLSLQPSTFLSSTVLLITHQWTINLDNKLIIWALTYHLIECLEQLPTPQPNSYSLLLLSDGSQPHWTGSPCLQRQHLSTFAKPFMWLTRHSKTLNNLYQSTSPTLSPSSKQTQNYRAVSRTRFAVEIDRQISIRREGPPKPFSTFTRADTQHIYGEDSLTFEGTAGSPLLMSPDHVKALDDLLRAPIPIVEATTKPERVHSSIVYIILAFVICQIPELTLIPNEDISRRCGSGTINWAILPKDDLSSIILVVTLQA